MKYKIIIKQCQDPQRASTIAAEVARWSGSTPDKVYEALSKNAICIRKEADEDDAARLSAQFGAIGAEVELIPVNGKPAAAAAAASATVQRSGDDYDEDDEPGRILSDAEYTDMVKQRADIFYVEKTSRVRNVEILCMILAIGAGIFLSTRTIIDVAVDFYDKLPEERAIKLATVKEIEAALEKKKEDEKKKEQPSDVKKLKASNSQGVSANKGGGDPRERVVKQGVLGIVSGQIKGKTIADGDLFAKGGFATDIDAIISGLGGLKQGADGGVGRRGAAGIGFGQGVGSGFGGGSGGINDLMNSLMPSSGGGLDLVKRGNLTISSPEFIKSGALTGGRSRASIQRVVMQNIAALRYAYNRRVRDKPGLAGTVTVKFAIDEFGKVTFAQVVGTTVHDPELENTVVTRVKGWVFEKIDKPGDITEVTYPFAFSQ